MDAQPGPDSAFAATLSPRERRLGGRLESFGDIVFGFAVAQCALQLPTVKGQVDLAHPAELVVYFGTFALTASLWLIFHRMMSSTFRASGVDLGLAFSYLALVSLIPYSLFAMTHDFSAAGARASVGAYTVLYATMTAISSTITFRNLRRGYAYLDDDERLRTWQSLQRHLVLFVMMSIASGIDHAAGATAAGTFLFGIAPAIRIVRATFRRVPSAARLGIRPRG